MSENLEKTVQEIIKKVKIDKDKALIYFTEKFEKRKISVSDLKVKEAEIEQAIKQVDKEYLKNIQQASENIFRFYRQEIKKFNLSPPDIDFSLNNSISTYYFPLDRVGVYVPGGKYSYPSSLLMGVIPALVCGVKEIVITTPNPTPCVLAAAKICGVNKIFRVGGAQAIAALAYGTETIPRVDKIVGPGNIYVTLAKKLVFGEVGIDFLAGPSEILIIADETANSKEIVADLKAQREHGENTKGWLITDSKKLRDNVQELLKKEKLNRFKIYLVKDLNEAIKISNEIAPEHLEIMIKNPRQIIKKVKNAGTVFIGRYTPVVVGDYWAGSSHILPTGGTARFSSFLSVEDFLVRRPFVYWSEQKLKKEGKKIINFAQAEGLNQHAEAIKVRIKGGD